MFGKSILLGFLAFIISLSVILSKDFARLFFDESEAAERARTTTVRVAVFGVRHTKSLETDLVKGFQDAYNLKVEYFYISDFTLLKQLWTNQQFEMVVGRIPFSELNFQGSTSDQYDQLELGLFCNFNPNKVSSNNSGTNATIKILSSKPHSELIKNELDSYESLADTEIIDSDLPPKQIESQKITSASSCIVAELNYSKSLEAIKGRMQLVLSFEKTYPLRMHFSKDQDSLQNLADVWIKRAAKESPIFRYWDQVEAAKYKMTLAEYRRLRRDIKEHLPLWISTMKESAEEFNVPWLLVAAVAYQESKWQSDATSHTGVKGFMQLTKKTADYVGVEDREDAEQSIQGGTNYLRYLYDKTPNHLMPFERWIFALASYNIGHAHMRDIRRIAAEKNMNPYNWRDLQKLLPLKAEKSFESQFYFGSARGNETVHFVRSVLAYHDYLKVHFHQERSPKSIQQLQTSRDF
jgi:membrane-bound lytic murein transglycosylase F